MTFPQSFQRLPVFILFLAGSALAFSLFVFPSDVFADSLQQNATGAVTGKLTVNPTFVNFGDVTIGSSTTQQITLKATNAKVTITSASSSSSLFVLNGTSFPITLLKGKSITVNVVFSPQTSGADSGTLTFVSNASNSKATESVSGTGTATTHSVILQWNASTSSVVGYNIYRAAGSSSIYARINSAVEPATTYTDDTAASGNTYTYAATAVNANGQESSYSTPVKVSIP
jgi:hypothetical protein